MSNHEYGDRGDGRPRSGSRVYGVMPAEAVVQRGDHGEGAEAIGNSARGALSGGLSGATTTRGGQQGGIGASAYDFEPGAAGESDRVDERQEHEQDLTLGERFGGAMEDPKPSLP
jgi:hypothetical protein